MQDRTRIGWVVTAVWTASALVGLATGDFRGLEVVSPVMVIFASYLFGLNIVRTGEKPTGSSPRRR